jgi:putative lipoprotein
MKIWSSLLLISLATLSGCTSPQMTESNPLSDTQDATTTLAKLDQPETIVHRDILLRGKLIIGSESSTLIPCGGLDQYTLILTPTQYQSLSQQTRHPYQEIYAELAGHLDTPSQTGFNADYRARMQVTTINFVAKDAVRGCSEPEHPTQAFGLSPQWLVAIQKNSLKIQQPKNISSPIKQQIQQRTTQIYRSNMGNLELNANLCRLQDGGQLYGWMAAFKTKNARYRGCARLSNKPFDQSWIATYQAQSANDNGLQIRLELLPNHRATTQYSYLNAPGTIQETGFWQALNEQQVEVVMTQHQQQYLISKRIFTKQGNTLRADKEKIGQKIYTISDGGLVLFKVAP